MAQFAKLNCSRGAPLGRSSDSALATDVTSSVRLFKVNVDRGGYDDGGAYWGIGLPLWCAIDGEGSRRFTRSSSRAHAAKVLGVPPSALKIKLADHV